MQFPEATLIAKYHKFLCVCIPVIPHKAVAEVSKSKVYRNQNKNVLIEIVCVVLDTSHSISTSHFRTRSFFLMTRTQTTKARLSTTKYYTLLLHTTKYFKLLQSTTQYYTIQPCTTKYNKILLHVTKYSTILLRTTKNYKVLLRTTKYYSVLQSIT